jgi:hypothetical protein
VRGPPANTVCTVPVISTGQAFFQFVQYSLRLVRTFPFLFWSCWSQISHFPVAGIILSMATMTASTAPNNVPYALDDHIIVVGLQSRSDLSCCAALTVFRYTQDASFVHTKERLSTSCYSYLFAPLANESIYSSSCYRERERGGGSRASYDDEIS